MKIISESRFTDMTVNRFDHYVYYRVFRAAVGYRILFGFHLLVPILGIWPHQAVSLINAKKHKTYLQQITENQIKQFRNTTSTINKY